MRAAAVVLLLFVGAFLAVAIPIYNDHQIQNVTRVSFGLGTRVADLALAASPGEWREIADGTRLLPTEERSLPKDIARIEVMKNGVVRVSFKSPGELAGKVMEIRTTWKEGKFTRKCSGDRIVDKFLPPNCRSDDEAFAIQGPPAPSGAAFAPNKGWYLSHPQKKTVMVDGLEVFVVPRGVNQYDAWGGDGASATDTAVLKSRQIRAVEEATTCKVASAEYAALNVLQSVVQCGAGS